MGNEICCQADLHQSLVFDGVPRETEFYETDWPENDEHISSWLKNVQNQHTQNLKPKKHVTLNKYFLGPWVDQVPEGKGIMYQPGVYIYDGAFSKGSLTGQAEIKFIKNQSLYSGNVINGKAEGFGTYDSMKQRFRFEGDWKESRPEAGKLTLLADENVSNIQFISFQSKKVIINYKDLRKYQGEINIEKLVPDGYGKVTFSPQNAKKSYEGYWKNGKMHGKGTLQWKDKSRYDGEYVDGIKEGKGMFFYSSGKIYEGQWKNGKQNGKGILYDRVGVEKKKGVWNNGTLENPLSNEEWEKLNKEKQESQKKQQEAQEANNDSKDEPQNKEMKKQSSIQKEEQVENAEKNQEKKEQQKEKSSKNEIEKPLSGSQKISPTTKEQQVYFSQIGGNSKEPQGINKNPSHEQKKEENNENKKEQGNNSGEVNQHVITSEVKNYENKYPELENAINKSESKNDESGFKKQKENQQSKFEEERYRPAN